MNEQRDPNLPEALGNRVDADNPQPVDETPESTEESDAKAENRGEAADAVEGRRRAEDDWREANPSL